MPYIESSHSCDMFCYVSTLYMVQVLEFHVCICRGKGASVETRLPVRSMNARWDNAKKPTLPHLSKELEEVDACV